MVATRSLSRKFEAIELLKEVLNDTIFYRICADGRATDPKQMGWQSRLANAGHAYALCKQRAVNTSKIARLEYVRGGLPALNSLTEFCSKRSKIAVRGKAGRALSQFYIYIKALLKTSTYHRRSRGITDAAASDWRSWQAPVDDSPTAVLIESPITTDGSDIAWLAQTNAFHHALVFAAVPTNHPDTPALMVFPLRSVLRNNHLHRTIREQGGRIWREP